MSSVAFTIPGQPQGKGRPRVGSIGGHARMFTPAKTVAYEGLIAHAAQQARRGRPMLEGPLVVNLVLRCQVPASWSKKKQQQALAGEIRPTTKPDIDNVLKAVLDGCNGVLWRDDVLVVTASVTKIYASVPAVDVMARELAPADEPTAQRELLGETA